jgi:hypothetical protein
MPRCEQLRFDTDPGPVGAAWTWESHCRSSFFKRDDDSEPSPGRFWPKLWRQWSIWSVETEGIRLSTVLYLKEQYGF